MDKLFALTIFSFTMATQIQVGSVVKNSLSYCLYKSQPLNSWLSSGLTQPLINWDSNSELNVPIWTKRTLYTS